MLSILSRLWALCMSSLEKCLFRSFAHFLNWIICIPGVESYDCFMYFGDQTLVQGITGTFIFPYGWFLFHLLIFSLAVQKLLILLKLHLFILFFMSLAVGDISVKILLYGISEILLPMCYSRTSMVWWLIFKSFIHIEFVFLYGVSSWSIFIFLHVAVQIS